MFDVSASPVCELLGAVSLVSDGVPVCEVPIAGSGFETVSDAVASVSSGAVSPEGTLGCPDAGLWLCAWFV